MLGMHVLLSLLCASSLLSCFLSFMAFFKLSRSSLTSRTRNLLGTFLLPTILLLTSSLVASGTKEPHVNAADSNAVAHPHRHGANASFSPPPPPPAPPLGKVSNVTLSSLTLFTKFNWFFNPSVFFRCKGEAKKELPFIHHLMVEYNFTGKEAWQPLTTLTGQQCKLCGLYQHLWFEDSTFFEWVVCTGDFGVGGREERPSWRSPDRVFVSLECLECSKQPLPHSKKDHSSHGASDSLGVIFWVFASIAAIGITLSLVSFIIFIAKNQDMLAEEYERTRFLDGGGDSAYAREVREMKERERRARMEEEEENEHVMEVEMHEPTIKGAPLEFEDYVVDEGAKEAAVEAAPPPPQRKHFSDILKDA